MADEKSTRLWLNILSAVLILALVVDFAWVITAALSTH